MTDFLCSDLTNDDGAARLHFNGVLPTLGITNMVYNVNRRRLTQSSGLFIIREEEV